MKGLCRERPSASKGSASSVWRARACPRWLLATKLFFTLALFSPGEALAQRESVITFCHWEDRGEELVRRLDGWMSSARLLLDDPPQCEAGGPHYLARFRQEKGALIFVLQNPAGGRLSRRIPWLRDAAAPLRELEAKSKLSDFSLLLEALLVEDRLGLADPPAPEPAPPAPAAPKAQQRRSRREQQPSPTQAARPQAQEEPTTSPPSAAPAHPPDEAMAPSEERTDQLSLEEESDAREAAGAALGGRPPPATPPSEVPPRSDSEEEAKTAPAEAHLAEDFGQPKQSSFFERWPLSLEGGVGYRLRSPGFGGLELGLGLGLGPVALQLHQQPKHSWQLAGRPLSVEALSFGAMLQHELALPASLHLRLQGGASLEQLGIQRAGLPGAQVQRVWDLGPSLGGQLRFSFGQGSIGLGAALGWMPGARTVRLPEGAAAPLGTVWGRLHLILGLQP